MQVKITAIEVLTAQHVASRAKSHLDAIISGVKNARRGGRYGFNPDIKMIVNQPIESSVIELKEDSDLLENDIRELKNGLTRHNATVKVSFSDKVWTGETREVTIFEAFNLLKDLDKALSTAHSSIISDISIEVRKDADQDDLPRLIDASEYHAYTDEYRDTLATITSLKRGIAKANNKNVTVELQSQYLLDLLGIE